MSSPSDKHQNKDNQQVAILRQKFLQEAKENSQLYNEEDVQKVARSDFYSARFLNFLSQGVEKGFEQMKEAYQWRKTTNLNNFNLQDYGSDYFDEGAIFPYLPDRDGDIVIHLRPKVCSKLKKENVQKLETYCMQVINAVDEKVQKEFGWSLLLNCSDISVADIDLNFIFQILPRLRKYFPNGCKYCVIYGLHWSVNYVCKMAVAAMPADSAKKIRFLGKESELLDLIDKDSLPDFLKGSAVKEYRKVPSLLNISC